MPTGGNQPLLWAIKEIEMPSPYQRTNNDIAKMHRQILFEEAKGKLKAMLATYHDEARAFEIMDERIENFIKEAEREIY